MSTINYGISNSRAPLCILRTGRKITIIKCCEVINSVNRALLLHVSLQAKENTLLGVLRSHGKSMLLCPSADHTRICRYQNAKLKSFRDAGFK